MPAWASPPTRERTNLRCARPARGRGDERDRVRLQRHHRVRGQGSTNTRTVIGSVVRATGVFRGVGRVVELVPPILLLVGQDDLVFRGGTMHVVSTPGKLSFSVNPHSCLFTGTQQLTWDVTGGTGQFADATGSVTGTVSAVALRPATPTAAAR